MTLRDHFRPPVSKRSSWEGFHGMWPAIMVQHLSRWLPDDFTAEPRVHLGTYFEIDVSAYEANSDEEPVVSWADSGSGAATVTYAPPEPSLALNTDLPEQYEYEVLIFDHSRERQLVAAVEIVSPANKDRPENRRTFVAKCVALLQKGICVSIVDPVTIRHFNLYMDLLELIGQTDPVFAEEPPATYAVTCRGRTVDRKPRLETWTHTLTINEPLPTLPVWLAEDLAVPLELDVSYEETCRALRIP